MVKRYYIKDYPENFRGNTQTRTVALDFIRPSIESSLTRRGKNRTDQACGHVGGQVYLMENRVKKNRRKGRKQKSSTRFAQSTRFVLGRKPQGTQVKNRKNHRELAS